jgi:hypothetical protein
LKREADLIRARADALAHTTVLEECLETKLVAIGGL